jgi:hypothetical protein
MIVFSLAVRSTLSQSCTLNDARFFLRFSVSPCLPVSVSISFAVSPCLPFSVSLSFTVSPLLRVSASLFHDAAVLHKNDAISEGLCQFVIVRHHNDRQRIGTDHCP